MPFVLKERKQRCEPLSVVPLVTSEVTHMYRIRKMSSLHNHRRVEVVGQPTAAMDVLGAPSVRQELMTGKENEKGLLERQL